ncbi:hypothetical protein PVK62_16750 [Aliivibrio sp. S3MY1]|uniref:hypothetical protein n=1 Tax=unclassified Aliivibrio TaxID=2645654 RepID=UPI0023786EA8|nr:MULTISPECIES: hypothetical protein [unclassified Aliivibrio]MDD9197476.1 hypothetical protein [Aliivibrio sp. S3MY1]MDD9200712.1 hypothetical protein [Aliivibrio sp. S2MY1]
MILNECVNDIPWVDILSGVSSIATVLATIVAYRALNTWKKGALLEKRIDSLDHVSETIFILYRNLCEVLIEVEVQNISIELSNDDLSSEGKESEIKNYLVHLAYLDSKKLRELLNKVEPHIDELELSFSKLNRLDGRKQKGLHKSFDTIKNIYHKLVLRTQVLSYASTCEINDKLIARVHAVLEQNITELQEELNTSKANMTHYIEVLYKILIS